MGQNKSEADELMDFLASFNKKYKEEHPAGDKTKAYRPKEAPDMMPCVWDFPCNNCGHCH